MMIETLFTLSKDGVDIDVEQWTERLGIMPLECCRFGNKIPIENSRNLSASSYWTTGILKTSESSITNQVCNVLDLIYPKMSEINALIDEYGLDSGISSFVWVEENMDASDIDIHIDTYSVKRLADLKCDFSVCIY